MCTIVEQSLRSLRFFSKSKMQKRMYILLSVQKYDHNHISLCRQNISKKTQQETGNNGGLSEGKQKKSGGEASFSKEGLPPFVHIKFYTIFMYWPFKNRKINTNFFK